MRRLVTLDGAATERLAEVHATAFERPWGGGDFQELISNLGAAVLGVEDGAGRLLGFVAYHVLGPEGEILTIAVRPESRRGGVGAALVEAAAGAAQALGAEVLWLEVAADNAAAIELYEKAGFSRSGRRRGYYRRGARGRVDALVMRRALNTGAPTAYSP